MTFKLSEVFVSSISSGDLWFKVSFKEMNKSGKSLWSDVLSPGFKFTINTLLARISLAFSCFKITLIRAKVAPFPIESTAFSETKSSSSEVNLGSTAPCGDFAFAF